MTTPIRPLVRLSAHQLTAGGGQEEVDYMLDRPPFTRYYWGGSSFIPVGGSDSLDTPLTGLGVGTPTQIEATNTILEGFENLQSQIDEFDSIGLDTVLTGLDTSDTTPVVASDSLLEGVGKLQGQINDLIVGGSYIGTFANQAAMLASGAAVGEYGIRTDLGTTATCTALPSSTLANWLIAESAVASDPSWRGVYTSVASLPSSSLVAGDTATLNLSGMTPFIVICDGANWKAMYQVFKRVCHREAGTTSASAQMASAWKWQMPAGLLTLFSSAHLRVFYQKSAAATDTLTGYVTLGGAGSTADTSVTPNPSPMISAANGSRSMEYEVTLLSNTTLRVIGTDVGSGTATNTTGTDANSLVTLGGSDDYTDALYWGVSVTMGGTTITPSVSLSVALIP